MKCHFSGLIFSDGSFTFTDQPRLRQSPSYRYLARDLNNHPSWVDYKVEYGEDIALFVSQFRDLKIKSKTADAKNIG